MININININKLEDPARLARHRRRHGVRGVAARDAGRSHLWRGGGSLHVPQPQVE